MSPRKPLRTVFVAVSAAAALTVAPALLTSLAAPAAYAAPSEYPLGGEEGSTKDRGPENGLAERAEKAGGGILSETIDLSADLLKCGLSIATPAINCPLGS